MNRKHDGFLVCDDLTSDIPIDKELLKEKFQIETKWKVIRGININDMLESLRRMEFNGDYRKFLKEWVEIE